MDTLVGEIATASNEQSQGIGQVTIAVSQMDKVTQSNAASAEESAASAEELNAQSHMLKDTVADLRQLVGDANNSGHGTMPGESTAHRPVTPKLGKPAKRPAIAPARNQGQHSVANARVSGGHDDLFKAS